MPSCILFLFLIKIYFYFVFLILFQNYSSLSLPYPVHSSLLWTLRNISIRWVFYAFVFTYSAYICINICLRLCSLGQALILISTSSNLLHHQFDSNKADFISDCLQSISIFFHVILHFILLNTICLARR